MDTGQIDQLCEDYFACQVSESREIKRNVFFFLIKKPSSKAFPHLWTPVAFLLKMLINETRFKSESSSI